MVNSLVGFETVDEGMYSVQGVSASSQSVHWHRYTDTDNKEPSSKYLYYNIKNVIAILYHKNWCKNCWSQTSNNINISLFFPLTPNKYFIVLQKIFSNIHNEDIKPKSVLFTSGSRKSGRERISKFCTKLFPSRIGKFVQSISAEEY